MKVWALVVAIGIIDALLFLGFEALVVHGTDVVWNEWFHTNTTRWLVVPVALILSVLFSGVVRVLGENRWVPVTTALHADDEGRATLNDIGTILAVGGTGLLAGASLGPEMPLSESAVAFGGWAKKVMRLDRELGTVMMLASFGALMVSFLGSMLLVLLPLILLQQKVRRLKPQAVGLIVLASGSAYTTLIVAGHHTRGFGSIPVKLPLVMADYWGAVAVALCVSIVALVLVKLIMRLGVWTHRLDRQLPWHLSAALFGVVLGGLYLVGGQTVQFNGNAGVRLLLDGTFGYGTWAFLGLALIKIAVTAWSKATGYRGGLYFPSLYAGVALGLWLVGLFPAMAFMGTMVGAIAAIFMALSIPAKRDVAPVDYSRAALVALLFMAALVPVGAIPLICVAIVAAGIGNKIILSLVPRS